MTDKDDKVLKSLTTMEARRHQTDVAFRSIAEIEKAARREKTERLKAIRMQSSTMDPG